MKIKLNLETLIYVLVIVLSLIVLTLGFLSSQYTNIKPVYEGF
jgi:hypothetical protein